METQKINKPVAMARDEFMKTLVRVTNESGLPLIIVEYVVRDFLGEVSRAAAQQASNEENEYKKMLTQTGDNNE